MISESYRAEQQRLHQNPNYGTASLGYVELVNKIIKTHRFQTLHDYGAGKQRLRTGLVPIEYSASDPAFPEYGPPREADLVTCIDVLEHVEPDQLEAVLEDLQKITYMGFFTIHTGPAVKVLSDGRNAHLIQRPARWWLPLLCKRWEIEALAHVRDGFWVVVRRMTSAE